MITDIILISLSLIVLIIASIFDIKTREVPDNLSIGFIAAAIIIRLIHSIVTSTYSYFLYGLLGLAIMFVIGVLMYKTRQWGGADAKILMGLGVVFGTSPFYSQLTAPFLLLLFINIIIVGGIYGFCFAVVLYFRNIKKARPLFNKFLEKTKPRRNIFLITAIILSVLTLAFKPMQIKFLLIVIAVFLIFYYYLSLFTRTIEKIGFIKQIPLSKVTEGDWLARDVIYRKKVLIKKRVPSLTLKHLSLMKKKKIKKVWIKIGIPFLPAMFLATVISLLLIIKGF